MSDDSQTHWAAAAEQWQQVEKKNKKKERGGYKNISDSYHEKQKGRMWRRRRRPVPTTHFGALIGAMFSECGAYSLANGAKTPAAATGEAAAAASAALKFRLFSRAFDLIAESVQQLIVSEQVERAIEMLN